MVFSVTLLYRLCGLVFVIFLVNLVTGVKLQTPAEATNLFHLPKPQNFVSVNNVDKTLECLALNIYREAGGEPFEGKVAVAQVVINRYNHPKFPKDICNVIYEKNTMMEKVVCQFSWYCESKLRSKPPNNVAYKESYAVAKKVLLEGFKLDMLNDALYFHSVHVNPRWPHQRIGRIGNHIFYRNKA